MSITATAAYLAMAWVVWFYALMPLADLMEAAAWNLAKPRRQTVAARPVSPAVLYPEPSLSRGARPAPVMAPAPQRRAA